MAVALFCIPSVERRHYFLGVQCDRRRRNFRLRGQCVPDVAGFRPVQMEPEVPARLPALHFPGGTVDSMGKILPGRGPDFLAVAASGQCLRTHRLTCPVVRMARHSRRLPVGVGIEPFSFRPDGFPVGRKLVPVQCQGSFRFRRCRTPDIFRTSNSVNVNVL